MRARRPNRRGLSLLEVMLAIAILGATMAAVGELIRTGTRAALRAQDMTTAQFLCENMIAEVATGLVPLQSSQGLFPQAPEWAYTIAVQQVSQAGLIGVQVIVYRAQDPDPNPFTYQLTRWVINPALKYPPVEETESSTDSSASSGAASTGTGS